MSTASGRKETALTPLSEHDVTPKYLVHHITCCDAQKKSRRCVGLVQHMREIRMLGQIWSPCMLYASYWGIHLPFRQNKMRIRLPHFGAYDALQHWPRHGLRECQYVKQLQSRMITTGSRHCAQVLYDDNVPSPRIFKNDPIRTRQLRSSDGFVLTFAQWK